jgi:cyclophilin family peptidyl-prolyl cis-trans isomerase
VKGLPPAPPPERTVSPHFGRRFASNTFVVMETTKGTLEIECYPGDAPVHVANFIGLVEKGFYDGRAWFRVVPNFVIQGGDALDSGWGDAGWSVRAEINAIPYERGTLGMPRSAGFDTGGCQLFFTHLPTPHLDGYYTVFGKVLKGLDVIDKIEIGDKIVKATLRR